MHENEINRFVTNNHTVTSSRQLGYELTHTTFELISQDIFAGGVLHTYSGRDNTLVIDAKNRLFVAGQNDYGKLGTGSMPKVLNFTQVKAPSGSNSQKIIQASAGTHCTHFLTNSGELYGMGDNYYVSNGALLGFPNTNPQAGPYYNPILIRTGVTAIESSFQHSVLIDSNSAAWGMGRGTAASYGQALATDLINASDFGAGIPYGWGYGIFQFATNVKQIFVGRFGGSTMYIDTSGRLWGTGGTHAQLGVPKILADPFNIYTLVGNFRLIAENVKTAALGTYHSMYVKNNDELWGSGINPDGQVGDGTIFTTITAHKLIDVDVRSVSCYGNSTVYVKNNNEAWGMGINSSDQLLQNTFSPRQQPVKIYENIRSAKAGLNHITFVTTDGFYKATGSDEYGQLGITEYYTYRPLYHTISNTYYNITFVQDISARPIITALWPEITSKGRVQPSDSIIKMTVGFRKNIVVEGYNFNKGTLTAYISTAGPVYTVDESSMSQHNIFANSITLSAIFPPFTGLKLADDDVHVTSANTVTIRLSAAQSPGKIDLILANIAGYGTLSYDNEGRVIEVLQ